MCGEDTPSKWGLPICSEDGTIVANDYEGEWGGIPACESCWAKHEKGAFVGEWPKF
jgi:hypothetical protein